MGSISAAVAMAKEGKYIIMAAAAVLFMTFLSFILINTSVTAFIDNWQQYSKKMYGDYLVVVNDVSEKEEIEIKSVLSDFCIDEFSYMGTLKIGDVSVSVGELDEKLYERFDIELENGRWPKGNNEVVLEEYSAYLLGINAENLPKEIKSDGGDEYTVTGIISNYAYKVESNGTRYMEHAPYPTALLKSTGEYIGLKSLVVTPVEWNWKEYSQTYFRIDRAIKNICGENAYISGNSQLDSYAYDWIKDFYSTRFVFNCLSVSVLCLVLFEICRIFLTSIKAKSAIIRALGMTKTESYISMAVMWLIVGLAAGGVSLAAGIALWKILFDYF